MQRPAAQGRCTTFGWSPEPDPTIRLRNSSKDTALAFDAIRVILAICSENPILSLSPTVAI